METLRVGYSRKVSPGNYESIGFDGSLEFKPASTDLQKEYDQALLALKLIVDQHIDKVVAGIPVQPNKDPGPLAPAPPPPPPVSPLKQDSEEGLPEMAETSFDEPDLGEQPEWVGNTPAPPPPPPNPRAPVPPRARPEVQKVTPVDKQDCYFDSCYVANADIKMGRSKKFATIRIGHDAFPGEGFVTARIFDPAYISQVGSTVTQPDGNLQVNQLNLNKGDRVNIWGSWSVWQTDPSKFDINATAFQKL